MGTSQTDRDIINEMVLWKLDRTVKIDDATLALLGTLAQAVTTPGKALKSPIVAECLDRLLDKKNKGIRLPMASTIMHLYCPEALPIVDERAYRQCGFRDWNPGGGSRLYLKYLGECTRLAREHRIPMTQIDKVLYQTDIEKGNRLGRR
jgi:hypothetical protein